MADFREYIAHGWKLCGISRGKKAPTYPRWNDPEYALSEAAAEDIDGAGLLHALSGTAALDLDDMEYARPWLAERGVDVDALLNAPDAVKISSGRYNRAKLIYRLKRPMRTLKPKGSGLELRCATADGKSVQDVLPPTIHPDTKKPYTWVYGDDLIGHWSSPPPMPSALLALWRSLLAEMPPERNEPTRMETPVDTVRKAIYKYINDKHKDVADHDDWLDVGMRLHEQTGGAQEGLDIWDEWSQSDQSKRKNGGPRYEGKSALELRWRSFHAGRSGNVGLAGAIAQLPAVAEDFDIEPDTGVIDEESTSQILGKRAKEAKAEAVAKLEESVVFVRNAEKYFNTASRRIFNTEAGIEHTFTSMMPRKKGGRRESPVQLLKESSTKRVVDEIGFHPGEGLLFKDDEDYTYVNAFDETRRPKAIEPAPGDLERIEWLFDLIDDPEYRKWLKQFYGHVVQRPGVKIKSAPLIWSEIQGSGKTTLVRAIPSLLVGRRYSKEITSTQLEDSFTGYLVDAWHINLTEFRASSRNEREAISKKVESWIADDAVTVRPMQRVAYTMPNHFFITASSNFDDAASITGYDRKWAIHELKAGRMTEEQSHWIYNEFLLQKRAAGVLRWYFEQVDLTGFSPAAKAIVTDARRDMIDASTSSDVDTLVAALEERTGPFAADVVVITELSEWLRKNGGFKPSFHRLGKILAKAPFNGEAKRFRAGDALYRAFIIRNHATWSGETGKAVIDHIRGVTDDLEEIDYDTIDLTA